MDAMDFLSRTREQSQQTYGAQQAPLWDLESRAPQPQTLYKGAINNVAAAWPILYTCPAGSFVQVQEILLFNGDAGSITWMFAILDEDDAIPSGGAIAQDNIFIAKTLATGVSERIEIKPTLTPGWRIAGYTNAAANVEANALITGLVVTYLA